MSDTETKLPKHLQAAINQLEKQARKYGDQIDTKLTRIEELQSEVDVISGLQSELNDQIKRLKGE